MIKNSWEKVLKCLVANDQMFALAIAIARAGARKSQLSKSWRDAVLHQIAEVLNDGGPDTEAKVL